uniref:Uncharacterized protein n=1 Tax=Arundo donax TaxID=35708 RepID=A0A0A8YT14_ARUDO
MLPWPSVLFITPNSDTSKSLFRLSVAYA